MYRWLKENNGSQRAVDARDKQESYDEFQGRIIVVDLAEIDGQTEDFEGRLWLEGRTRDKLPVGWDLEWQPDRTKDSDNPIALMQFADDSTALLLRTHRTRNWLPISVMKALLSEGCTKVGVGWDGPDKQKMQSTFNFLPVGIYDLSEIAKKKQVTEQGLKSLTEHFGYKMRKDSRIARSNWAANELTKEQVQYAAEDAYFSFLLYDKLRSLPSPLVADKEGYAMVNQGVLELQPGWREQGIERRHDGLWCQMCEKGPMTVPLVVERHMSGQRHRKKLEQKNGIPIGPDGTPEELPEEYVSESIYCGDGINNLKIGEYKCKICNAGPFNNLQTVDAHLKSKRHLKSSAPLPETEKPADDDQKDPFTDNLWNLPDYVRVTGNVIECTLCPAKANAFVPMCMHLGGDRHARKCRQLGYDEILYIKERERLEAMRTGRSVVRSGFKAPKNDDAEVEKKVQNGKDGKGAKTPLPAGWSEFKDSQSGLSYYYNSETKASQWDRPAPPAAPEPPVAADPPLPNNLQNLPPGWAAAWCETSKRHYYADVENQASQWDPPSPYVHGDWKRQVDTEGRAFWASGQLKLSFYENDSAWSRLVDCSDRVYWSNKVDGVRFFEKKPEVLAN